MTMFFFKFYPYLTMKTTKYIRDDNLVAERVRIVGTGCPNLKDNLVLTPGTILKHLEQSLR